MNIETLRAQLKEAEEKYYNLETRLGQLRLEQKQIKLKIAELEYGLFLSSVVKNSEGKLFRVTFIDTDHATPWVTANPKRRDGTWGRTVKHLYRDWEVVK